MGVRLGLAAIALSALCGLPAGAANLVPNGDFEAGDTGFTSGYAYSPAVNSAEGQYTVRANPFPWNALFASAGDHTTGSGLMLVANGSPIAGTILWRSSPISIASNTKYFFEAFGLNACCSSPYGGNTPAELAFGISLDGGPAHTLDVLTIPLNPAGVWRGLSTNFDSGSATTVSLFLLDANIGVLGNDFAVDDISLDTVSQLPGPPPSIPEPAAWALMLTGFGMAGAVLRRRRADLPA